MKLGTVFALALMGNAWVFSASIPTTRPTIANAREAFEREVKHLAEVEKKLEAHPELARSSYVRTPMAVAKRFIERMKNAPKGAHQQVIWGKVQMEEVGDVLKDVEVQIALVEAGKWPTEGLGVVRAPDGGNVRIEDGLLVTKTDGKERPFFFGGYGHFGQIFKDLPNFEGLGVTLVQDGRNGPNQGLKEDFSLSEAGREVKGQLARAREGKVKVDILTSPHYFPGWAVARAPEMQNGSAFHNVDHPKQREVNEAWLRKLSQSVKDEPALLSWCLSNEPVYGSSGHDSYSRPMWVEFLKKRHESIEKLNALYGTTYAKFEDVPPSGWGDDVNGKRRAFDWIGFNNQHFAGWHKWMGDVLKEANPKILTHAKIMVFFVFDRDKQGWGIDPECFADAADLGGCDAYAQQHSGVGWLDEGRGFEKQYAYHWQVQEMCYDLLNSFRNQPVFNSENHPMPNASGVGRIPAAQTRAVMWQGGLHHQGAQTTWVWEEPSDDSLLDTIYFRPANIWAASKAQMDLNRLWEEVAAINRAPARVAILYSPASNYWEEKYGRAVLSAYTALTFRGEKVTFVSERQLAEKRAAKVEWIVLPQASHVTASTYDALAEFGRGGGKVFLMGDECLGYDEYHRKREVPAAFAGGVRLEIKGDDVRFPDNRSTLVNAGTEQAASGVEYRVVEHKGAVLVPLMNLTKKTQKVAVKLGAKEGVDLVSQQMVQLEEIELNPMEPLLLRVAR